MKKKRSRLQILLERKRKYSSLPHASSQCVQLPARGEDAAVDEAVQRGLYRRVVVVAQKGGKVIRLACTKGVTFRKPKESA